VQPEMVVPKLILVFAVMKSVGIVVPCVCIVRCQIDYVNSAPISSFLISHVMQELTYCVSVAGCAPGVASLMDFWD
jgi:hypothetical protein